MDREQAPESAPPAWWWGGAVLGVVISAVLAWQLHRVAGAAFADAGLGALPWLVLALGLVATALLAVGYRRIAGVRAEMAHSLALRASALAETETRFASAFEHVAVGMTHIALDGQWLRVNATLCSMVGYPREELLGKGFAGITHPDDLPRDLAAKTAMSRGEIDQYVAEKRYFHRDGHAIWVRVVVSPVLDAQHRPLYYVSVVEDIGARRRAEAQARETQRDMQRWLSVIEGAGHGLWAWDAATGKVDYSSTTKQMIGFEDWELENSLAQWLAMVHPDDLDHARQSLVAHLRGHTPLWKCEHRVRYKLGAYRWLLSCGRVVERDAEGRATRVVGTNTDVTEQKEIARAAYEAQLRWQFALESADHGVWDWDVTTDVVFYSSRWKSMLGYADDEVGSGLTEWSERVHPDDIDAAMRAVNAHLEGHTENYTHEHRLRHKDGSWRWILDRGKAVERDAAGRALRVIGTHTDMTAHRQAAAALHVREQQLSTLVEALPDAVLLKDGGGRWQLLNGAGQDAFGLHGVDWAGRTDAELARMYPARRADFDTFRDSDERTWEAGTSVCVRRDGAASLRCDPGAALRPRRGASGHGGDRPRRDRAAGLGARPAGPRHAAAGRVRRGARHRHLLRRGRAPVPLEAPAPAGRRDPAGGAAAPHRRPDRLAHGRGGRRADTPGLRRRRGPAGGARPRGGARDGAGGRAVVPRVPILAAESAA